ncbi:MAG: BlaI/MecI/CopY family transcriptional regulator [Chthoniobacteraceae bacterium]
MTSRKPANATTAPTLPAISDAEWVVMQEFWQRGDSTAADIIFALEGRMHWKPRTVQSLINRLAGKGALGFTKIGREHLYRPLVAEADCVMEASRKFVDRIFGGRLAPLLACFVESGEVSTQDIAKLREILESSKKEAKKK